VVPPGGNYAEPDKGDELYGDSPTINDHRSRIFKVAAAADGKDHSYKPRAYNITRGTSHENLCESSRYPVGVGVEK
jgi:hypothetical protein